MLEHHAFFLPPWNVESPRQKTRTILDGKRTNVLGFAEWRRRPAFLGLSWLRRPVAQIYETEDRSLVCTVLSRWGRRWEVVDAEERSVGAFSTTASAQIEDPFGRRMISIARIPRSGRVLLSELNGAEIGAITLSDDGTRMELDAAWECNPFVKMVLLSAAILIG
jgi:hypothetical protein